MSGTGSGPRLIVIGTPIGNLADLSPRAATALASCDLLACEDTRRTGRLLELSGIGAPRLVRLDQHRERDEAPRLIERVLRESLVLGVVSDAGMPGLSDPGSLLVDAAVAAGLAVEVVPGPFAAVVALVASGLLGGDSRFVFEGFLPRRPAERQRRLSELAPETRPLVIYESPHRLVATLEEAAQIMGGERSAAVARELTKLHEEVRRGTLATLAAHYGERAPKGECVLVVAGAAPAPGPDDSELLAAFDEEIARGLTPRDAAASVAKRFGVKANQVKRLVFGPHG